MFIKDMLIGLLEVHQSNYYIQYHMQITNLSVVCFVAVLEGT